MKGLNIMFEEVCSIYSDALDNVGRYVDMETGECIQQMTIREFCLTDRWKPYVVDLRYLIEVFGSKAKKVTWQQVCEDGLAERYQMYYERMVDDIKSHRRREDTDADIEKRIAEGSIYDATKKSLPGATLSGLFATWNDECYRKDGSSFFADVSRRETHLWQYTGWLVIDIDLGDNRQLSNFDNIYMTLKFRPEVALLMHSCSGTGLFGLVRLDEVPPFPEGVDAWKHITDHHKARFKALREEYAALGINLDASCGNVGRVRFASWDEPEHIYINNNVKPYCGKAQARQMLVPLSDRRRTDAPRSSYQGGTHIDTQDETYRKALRYIEKLEASGKILMKDYDDWIKVGMALYDVDSVYGIELWKRISRLRPADSNNGHCDSDFTKRWHAFANYPYSAGWFFSYCQDKGVTLTREDYDAIYRR